MFMNFSVYSIGIIGFFVAGFALMYGSAGPIGNLGGTPALAGGHGSTSRCSASRWACSAQWVLPERQYYDVAVPRVPVPDGLHGHGGDDSTGALAERWRLKSFLAYGFFMSVILYPIFDNWAWGGGWLAKLGENFGLGAGYLNFAGSGVVMRSVFLWRAR